MERVSQLFLKIDCPVFSITVDRKVTAMGVVMQMFLVGWQRGLWTGSLGERAGTLHRRVADVLHKRTVSERAATLH